MPYPGKNKDQQYTHGVTADVPSVQAGNAKGAKNTITEEKNDIRHRKMLFPYLNMILSTI